MNLVERLDGCEGFQWDDGNSAKIWKKHQVAIIECEEIFLNRPFIVAPDEEHSVSEERFYALGCTEAGRLLFAAFTIRGNFIRVISARDMSRKERKLYLSS